MPKDGKLESKSDVRNNQGTKVEKGQVHKDSNGTAKQDKSEKGGKDSKK